MIRRLKTLTLILFVVLSAFSFFQFPIREAKASVSDDWYYTDFAYRVEHNITGSTAGDQTDYQMKITIVNGSGTSSDDTYYTTNIAQSDFDDVRFTWYNSTSGEEEPCSYWNETVNDGQNATFWVKIPEIPSSGTTTIYVYYGNSTVSSEANGTATFEFFDDFSGDLSKWTVESGSWSISSGKLYVDASGSQAIIRTSTYSGSNYSLMCDWYFINWRSGSRDGLLTRYQDTSNFYAYWLTQLSLSGSQKACALEKRIGGSWSSFTYTAQSFTTGVWYELEHRVYGNSLEAWFEGTQKVTTTYTNFASGKIGFRSYYNDIYIDNVRVRKYVSPEPSHGSWGTEEEQQPTGTAPSVEEEGRTTNEKGQSCTFYAKWNSGSGSLSHWRFRWNGSGSWEWYPSSGYYSFSSLWSNITLTLPSTENVVVEWFIEANNTDGLWGNTTIQRLLVVKSLPQVMEEDFGFNTEVTTWGHGVYVNGTVDAIYLAFSNSGYNPWMYQIKAFNLENYTWTASYNISSSPSDDRHWCPSVGLLPNGSLIYFKGYYDVFQYRVSKYSAVTETNLTKVMTEWHNWTSVPYPSGEDDHCYPLPVNINDTLLLFGRIGYSSQGNFSMWVWNETSGSFNDPIKLIRSEVGYGYPVITTKPEENLIFIVWTGNQSYSDTHWKNFGRAVWMMYSNDTGQTWYSINGTKLTLPLDWNNKTCLVTSSKRTRVNCGAELNENGEVQIVWLVADYYPNYEVPSYVRVATWNGSIGQTGEWFISNLTDMNGNPFVNCTAAHLVFDGYYNRTSLWIGFGKEMRKYVFYNWTHVDYVYSDVEKGRYLYSGSTYIEDSPEAYEIITQEHIEIIGHGQFETNSSSYINVDEGDIIACKFTAEETGWIVEVQFKADSISEYGNQITFRAGIYNSTLHRIGYSESDSYLMSRASVYKGWSLRNVLTHPAYVEKGEEYYITINFEDSGSQNYIRFFKVDGATNQTFKDLDAGVGTSLPATLSPDANYSYQMMFVGYEVKTKIRGLGIRPAPLQILTNSTQGGQPCLFSVKWKAYSGTLDTAILYTNTTGTMQQRGTYTFPAGQSIAWANITDTLPSGGTLAWYMIANNTAGVWGNTTVQYLQLGRDEHYTLLATFMIIESHTTRLEKIAVLQESQTVTSTQTKTASLLRVFSQTTQILSTATKSVGLGFSHAEQVGTTVQIVKGRESIVITSEQTAVTTGFTKMVEIFSSFTQTVNVAEQFSRSIAVLFMHGETVQTTTQTVKGRETMITTSENVQPTSNMLSWLALQFQLPQTTVITETHTVSLEKAFLAVEYTNTETTQPTGTVFVTKALQKSFAETVLTSASTAFSKALQFISENIIHVTGQQTVNMELYIVSVEYTNPETVTQSSTVVVQKEIGITPFETIVQTAQQTVNLEVIVKLTEAVFQQTVIVDANLIMHPAYTRINQIWALAALAFVLALIALAVTMLKRD